MHRRRFLQLTALSTLHWSVLGKRSFAASSSQAVSLLPAGDLLDLPRGFHYQILQRAGDAMSDGHIMPIQPDGMCCLKGKAGQWVLLRNHEIGQEGLFERYGFRTSWVPDGGPSPSPLYREQFFGGVSRVVLNPRILRSELAVGANEATTSLVSSNMALGGTEYNCAGGVVPEGWVTCEETDRADHGWAFLVRPDDDILTAPRRITSWGRLKREGIALDTRTGICYMSEDHKVGCLYRHVPADPKLPMANGKLQALSLVGTKTASENVERGQSWTATWVDIADPNAAELPCRSQAAQRGATTFSRTEGIIWDGTELWFVCTNGGPIGAGQIFRYNPKTSTLTLAEQVTDRSVLSMPDNCTLTPWGDLLLAEDNYGPGGGCTHQYLRILTREGRVLNVARNRRNELPGIDAPGSEFTGPCFSPDGTVLFVNLQSPENVTLAITGPWKSLTR